MTSVQAINAPPTLSAAQAVGEYLQSPDDLLKLVAFRKKLEKEKASIDARLKSGVKEQLDATKDGLRKLFGTRNNVQAVRDEMETVDRLCSDPKNVVPTFDQISRVSMVHRNFGQVEEMVNNLLEMSSKLDMLEAMLASNREEVVGPAPNLLAIHYNINQLEAFRNQTMHQAKKASADSRNTLTRWFERLNKLIKSFDEYIVDLARNILPLIRAGHSEVIVKLVKIAEIEGKEDEKAIAIRLVKRAAKMDAAAKFRSMQADARVFKHYRSNITKTIIESIKRKFEDALKEYEQDPAGFLDSLGWMYQDLIRIEEDVVPCFPPEWEIYSLFVREYHKTLNATLQKLLMSEPEASVLLTLHAWLKEYKKNMKELNVPPELMEPPLLDGKEQGLIEDYVNLIIKKLDEWTNNLMKTEIQAFTTRSEPLEEDSEGQYAMQGAIILFQMVNQQVDVAMESGQGAILARVVSEVNRVMRMIQEQWTKTLEGEFKKHVEKPEEAVPGLVEHTIALANDQIKSADFTEALSARLEPLVSEKYRVTISERLNDAIDGFLDVAKKCIQTLIDIIFNDLKPVTKQLFQQTWYDGTVIEQIVATMRDYMGDCQAFLNPTLLELLVEDLLDQFLVTYITALVNSPSKLKMPAATDRIKDDVSAVFKFFSAFKQPKELEESFEVIEMILGMLEASKSMVFLSFWSFAKVHGPNIQFVESLMKIRGDFDRSAANEVMESVKRKVKDEDISDPPEPTIMKKISIQSTFSRLLQRAT
ncbi:exocyst complex component sec6 [Gloeophyllum trabeum ATCC 11539]|uniref:Exocyst complex component sec6 n=1 Tax=Gloeophyllum trabeum (strain ATCC 11539 / FP-39264 / Madison 617) TaxID=670483 RepID=S7RPN4_GLOTA|nr:exocyst complex component sec6 [Gloeophyllum trabeum ATCC 11539]EPQ56510.1 exocyst complex component sec6 [Gloeophyllum trabeum ATCC 11539]